MPSRRTLRTAMRAFSAYWPTSLASSLRRSSVMSGIGRRISWPSVIGLRPRLAARMAFSTGCTFERTSFFDATLVGCKLTGSELVGCTLLPLTVDGGDWSYVSLRQADLRRVELTGLNLEEVDLAEADLTGASLHSCRMARASLRGALLRGASRVGSDLSGVQLAEVDLRGVTIDLAQAALVAESLGATVV